MRALDRKLWRDLWRMRGQALAIIAVVTAGVALYVSQLSTLDSLRESRDRYYAAQRFADMFASCKLAPEAAGRRLAGIEGVAEVETRLSYDVTLDIAGLEEPATGRMVSIPEDGRPKLNDLFLRSGRWVEPAASDEVLASEGFMLAHGMRPGDSVQAVLNGRRRRLVIVGVALSPEYIYSLRPGEFIPDDRRFGVFWIGRKALEAAFDAQGAFNDVALQLEPGASPGAVTAEIERVLDRFGGFGVVERKDQTSHWYLENELKQLAQFGLVMPLIFLGVAAFLLNVVVSRVIALQRDQLAALKAFGYSNLAIGLHYMKLVLVIMTLGALAGSGLGAWMGSLFAGIYAEFYRFPALVYALDPGVVATAAGATTAAGLVGTLGSVRAAVALAPAEAMRPPAPPRFRATLVERLGLQGLLSMGSRIILRNLERRPLKALLSITGIALAAAILVLAWSFLDAIDYLLAAQFRFVQREDVSVSFVEPRSRGALHDLRSLPGVARVEPVRNVAAKLVAGPASRRVSITGLARGDGLRRVLDVNLRPVEVPEHGLMLSSTLAAVLDVRAGSRLRVEVLEGRKPVLELVVSSVVDDFLGLSATMELGALNRALGEDGVVTGAFLSVERAQRRGLYSELKNTPAVSSVVVKDAAVRGFEEVLARNLLLSMVINIGFAAVIALGVVYNAARVSLSERARELASMRVLGMTRGEISAILLGELAILVLLAMPLGCWLGVLMVRAVSASFDSEIFRLPVVTSAGTLSLACIVVAASAVISALLVRRKLDRLDLVEVLKARE